MDFELRDARALVSRQNNMNAGSTCSQCIPAQPTPLHAYAGTPSHEVLGLGVCLRERDLERLGRAGARSAPGGRLPQPQPLRYALAGLRGLPEVRTRP